MTEVVAQRYHATAGAAAAAATCLQAMAEQGGPLMQSLVGRTAGVALANLVANGGNMAAIQCAAAHAIRTTAMNNADARMALTHAGCAGCLANLWRSGPDAAKGHASATLAELATDRMCVMAIARGGTSIGPLVAMVELVVEEAKRCG
eukprot:4594417-Pyramimonas_sp.AAC.1